MDYNTRFMHQVLDHYENNTKDETLLAKYKKQGKYSDLDDEYMASQIAAFKEQTKQRTRQADVDNINRPISMSSHINVERYQPESLLDA